VRGDRPDGGYFVNLGCGGVGVGAAGSISLRGLGSQLCLELGDLGAQRLEVAPYLPSARSAISARQWARPAE
jgi:hypothetical protein